MGNCQCQAADVATVLIQHPGGGRTERAYWALSAAAVMAANPGHYVAAVITTTAAPPAAGGDEAAASSAAAAAAPVTVKHLKLLRPDDTLLLGRVYRLVSFEEVLREFASKKQVKLSRVTVRAKDEAEDVKPAFKSKRRGRRARAASAGERKESSERSLAKVMRRTEEEEEEELEQEAESGPSSGPTASAKHGDADTETEADVDAELEALLQPHGALLGRRAARQWRPALQSIAEG